MGWGAGMMGWGAGMHHFVVSTQNTPKLKHEASRSFSINRETNTEDLCIKVDF